MTAAPLARSGGVDAPRTTAVVRDSRDVMQAHARSFTLAALFLPSGRSARAAVLYALCRLADDLADESPDPTSAAAALDLLEAEVRGDAPARPLVAEWLQSGDAHPEAFLALLDGVRSDLSHAPFASDRQLVRYCYAVAGTVGLAMCPILGVTEPAAQRHAIDLGIAMQLTNICRDVLEDAERGRVYLPAERLRAHGATPEEVLGGTADRQAVAAVVQELLERADVYYASGDHGMRAIPLRTRVAIVVASRVYASIGHLLRRRGGDSLAGRAIVSVPGRVLAVVRALCALPMLSLRARRPHDAQLHRHLDGLPGAAPQS